MNYLYCILGNGNQHLKFTLMQLIEKRPPDIFEILKIVAAQMMSWI